MANTEKTTVVKRVLIGEVMSVSGQKTVVVKISTHKKHAKYSRPYLSTKKYSVHDEKSVARVGDNVKIESCRPLSATKRWRLLEVIKKV